MPIPWLTVLQAVPWSEVISNAPKVADGAKKLWKTIGKKPVASTAEVPTDDQASSPTIASLHARLVKMETAQVELHDQMLASSELIKALAEQNALLILRAELMRVRIRRMLVAITLLGMVAIYGLAQTFPR